MPSYCKGSQTINLFTTDKFFAINFGNYDVFRLFKFFAEMLSKRNSFSFQSGRGIINLNGAITTEPPH